MSIADIFFSNLNAHRFFKQHYEKNVFTGKTGEYIFDLLPINQINKYFNQNNLRFPEITLFSKGDRITGELYKQSNSAAHNLIDKEKLWKYYEEGATIKIENANLAFSSIENFCKNAGNKLCANVKASIFITPPNSKASVPHYDMHDVFILQMHGEKIWKLFGKAYEKPIDGQLIRKSDLAIYDTIKPNKQFSLHPSDLIYIPRGFVHDAYTGPNSSVHITISVHPKVKFTMLKEIIDNGIKHSKLREYVYDNMDRTSLKKELLDTVSQLIDEYFIENNSVENNSNRMEFIDKFLSLQKHDQLI